MDTDPASTTSTDCGHPDGFQRAPSYLFTELLSATSRGSQLPWPGDWEVPLICQNPTWKLLPSQYFIFLSLSV